MNDQAPETQIAVLQEQVGTLIKNSDEMKGDIKEIKEKLDDRYVTKEDFNFWRNVLVSMVSAALIMSFGLLLDILFKINKF